MGMKKMVPLHITVTQDLWPPAVIDEIQRVMEEGEAKGRRGWEDMPADTHVLRAARHLNLDRKGDKSEDHLAHAFTRLMMALAIRNGYMKGDDDA